MTLLVLQKTNLLKNKKENIEDAFSFYISHENLPAVLNSEESQETWKEFFTKTITLQKKYKNYLSPWYLEGLKKFSFQESKIPTLSELSNCLQQWGWEAVWVSGYVPARIYAGLIARGYFPIARIMRRKIFLEHSPLPDFIHDIWGHLPLLCNPIYSQYIQEIALAIEQAKTSEFDQLLYEREVNAAMLKHEEGLSTSPKLIQAQKDLLITQNIVKKNLSQQMRLARVFLWTIEFGILKSSCGNLEIIGAGILSSPQEWVNIVEKRVKTHPYSLEIAMEHDFIYFSDLQPEFFVAPSLESYRSMLSSYLHDNL